MTDTFKISDDEGDRANEFAVALEKLTDEFLGGASDSLAEHPDNLGSVAARVLLEQAWAVAAKGRLAVSGEPRPERFAAVAMDVAKRQWTATAVHRFILEKADGGKWLWKPAGVDA